MVAAATRAFRLYSTALQRHPWRTQIVTTGILWAAGDVMAQRFEKGPFNPRRCALTAAYGASFVGPVGHAWYIGLDKAARALFTPGTLAFVGGKVMADTAIFGPVHVAGYFTYMTLLEGGTLSDVFAKLQRDFWPTFSAELAIWPVVQAVNFTKVPVEYQLFVVNLFTILDASFMSWSRSNDGWFPRYFPNLAAQLGMEMPAAAGSSGSSKSKHSSGAGTAGSGDAGK